MTVRRNGRPLDVELVQLLSAPKVARHTRVRRRVYQVSRTYTFEGGELSEFHDGYRTAFATMVARLPNVVEPEAARSVRDVTELIENQIRIGKRRA